MWCGARSAPHHNADEIAPLPFWERGQGGEGNKRSTMRNDETDRMFCPPLNGEREGRGHLACHALLRKEEREGPGTLWVPPRMIPHVAKEEREGQSPLAGCAAIRNGMYNATRHRCMAILGELR